MRKFLEKIPIVYKILCVFIIFTTILFILNLLLEKQNYEEVQKIEQEEQKEEEKEKEIIEYKAGQTIRVYMSKEDKVVAMDINDYLRGVVPSEMPPDYNLEAIKAQAIVARTYTYRKINDKSHANECDICDNYAHCQAFYTKEKLAEIWAIKGFDENTRTEYFRKVNEAVVSTQNQVILYNNELIKAFFHASSPKRTENIDQIWGNEKLPYLVSVENQEDESYKNRNSVVSISYNDFIKKINEELKFNNLTQEKIIQNCKIKDYTTSGRVKNITVCGYIISAEKLRTLFGLKSTDFKLKLEEKNIVFEVTGYGHGIGLSQVGANYYANIRNEL